LTLNGGIVSLEHQIEELYSAFSSQQRPGSIATCPCCLSAESVCSLLATPLRKLTPEQLSDYAAKVLLTAGSNEDFRYFFPRILEISITEPGGWWPSIEVVLEKLVLADWQSWSVSERSALVATLNAAFAHSIQRGPEHIYELDALMCGLGILGIDREPYLKQLSTPVNAEMLFAYYEHNSASLQKGKLSNSFWSNHRDAAKPILAWLNSEPIQSTIGEMQRQRYG